MTDHPAVVDDVHQAARAMPHVTVEETTRGTVVYQVGRKSFVIWVSDPAEKQALVQDDSTPFLTTPHFAGHPSVLVRASRLHETGREQIRELVEEAWLARASATRCRAWLAQQDRG